MSCDHSINSHITVDVLSAATTASISLAWWQHSQTLPACSVIALLTAIVNIIASTARRVVIAGAGSMVPQRRQQTHVLVTEANGEPVNRNKSLVRILRVCPW